MSTPIRAAVASSRLRIVRPPVVLEVGTEQEGRQTRAGWFLCLLLDALADHGSHGRACGGADRPADHGARHRPGRGALFDVMAAGAERQGGARRKQNEWYAHEN